MESIYVTTEGDRSGVWLFNVRMGRSASTSFDICFGDRLHITLSGFAIKDLQYLFQPFKCVVCMHRIIIGIWCMVYSVSCKTIKQGSALFRIIWILHATYCVHQVFLFSWWKSTIYEQATTKGTDHPMSLWYCLDCVKAHKHPNDSILHGASITFTTATTVSADHLLTSCTNFSPTKIIRFYSIVPFRDPSFLFQIYPENAN